MCGDLGDIFSFIQDDGKEARLGCAWFDEEQSLLREPVLPLTASPPTSPQTRSGVVIESQGFQEGLHRILNRGLVAAHTTCGLSLYIFPSTFSVLLLITIYSVRVWGLDSAGWLRSGLVQVCSWTFGYLYQLGSCPFFRQILSGFRV